MRKFKKLLILSSGGDAPGMNSAIRSAVRSALFRGVEVFGCAKGYEGLVEKEIFPMAESSVANILQRGGTMLKTARSKKFYKDEVQDECRQFLTQQGFDGLLVLGGNGSFQGARKLARKTELQVIGVPCTIDNDIVGTDYTIGFDTARNTSIRAIDNIRDTAMSHERNFIIEVMGRATGFLAVDVGLAAGAEVILTPEYPLTASELIEKLKHKTREKLTSIIVAAESEKVGHSFQLADEIHQGCGIEYKVCVLGHIQRGGSPSAKDRLMGTLMGAKAIEGFFAGVSNVMVASDHDHLSLAAFADKDNAVRYFNDPELLELNDVICEIK